jgi:hypothetical protein
MQKTVHINGVDVSDQVISFTIERTNGKAIAQANIRFKQTINDVVTLINGATVQIWRGWSTATDDKPYSGYLDKFEPFGSVVDVTSSDKLLDLVRREVVYSYDEDIDASAGQISEIFKDLVNTWGGMTADNTSVQASPTTAEFKLKKFVCNHISVMDACKQLADTLNWQFYYEANTNKVYFEPKGYENHSTILYTGSGSTYTRNILNTPKWNINNIRMQNIVTVIGAEQLTWITLLFSGNGVSKGPYQLDFTPADVHVYYGDTKDYQSNAPVQSEEQEGGIENSSSSADYYVDTVKKQVTFTTTGPTPSNNTRNVCILYAYATPTPVKIRNDASETTFGPYEKTLFLTDVKNVADAEARARRYLEVFSQPFYSTEVKVQLRSDALDVGQSIRIIDELNNPTQDRWLTINKYVIAYPNKYDTLTIGSEEFTTGNWESDIEKKIHKINESMAQNQTVLTQVIDSKTQEKLGTKTFIITKKTMMDSFILGDPINGLLGMGRIIDECEATTGWSSAGTLSLNANPTYIKVGSGSLKVIKTYGSDVNIYTSNAYGDLSSYTGVGSGLPSQGTVGIWIYITSASTVSNITLGIGSSGGHRLECLGGEYRTRHASGYTTTQTTGGFVNGWNYVLFDLNTGTAFGTPNWGAVGYVFVLITDSANGTYYFDYLTISSSNYIGLNGLGSREISTTVYSYTR